MRPFHPFIRLLMAGVVVLAGAGCSGTRFANGADNRKTLTVVMITHGQATDPFWNVVKNGADAAARDKNITVDYEAPARGDPVEMARLVKAAIARRPAGIAVSIPDADALREPLSDAIKAGIPVVSLNSGADAARQMGVLAHVGQDEGAAGSEGGQRMACAGVRKALCIIHEQGNTSLDVRCAGFLRAMRAAGGSAVRLVIDGSDPTDARRLIEGALAKDRTIDGIFTLGPLGFVPALQVVDREYRHVKLATFDLSPEILEAVRDGEALFAIDQQPWLQGYLPVQMLADNARYGLHLRGTVLTGPNFVTKDDAATVIDLSSKGLR